MDQQKKKQKVGGQAHSPFYLHLAPVVAHLVPFLDVNDRVNMIPLSAAFYTLLRGMKFPSVLSCSSRAFGHIQECDYWKITRLSTTSNFLIAAASANTLNFVRPKQIEELAVTITTPPSEGEGGGRGGGKGEGGKGAGLGVTRSAVLAYVLLEPFMNLHTLHMHSATARADDAPILSLGGGGNHTAFPLLEHLTIRHFKLPFVNFDAPCLKSLFITSVFFSVNWKFSFKTLLKLRLILDVYEAHVDVSKCPALTHCEINNCSETFNLTGVECLENLSTFLFDRTEELPHTILYPEKLKHLSLGLSLPPDGHSPFLPSWLFRCHQVEQLELWSTLCQLRGRGEGGGENPPPFFPGVTHLKLSFMEHYQNKQEIHDDARFLEEFVPHMFPNITRLSFEECESSEIFSALFKPFMRKQQQQHRSPCSSSSSSFRALPITQLEIDNSILICDKEEEKETENDVFFGKNRDNNKTITTLLLTSNPISSLSQLGFGFINLRKLEMKFLDELRDLRGIGNLPALQECTIVGCAELSTIDHELAKCESLTTLSIRYAPKLSQLDSLFPNLLTLTLVETGIKSLCADFYKYHPNTHITLRNLREFETHDLHANFYSSSSSSSGGGGVVPLHDDLVWASRAHTRQTTPS